MKNSKTVLINSEVTNINSGTTDSFAFEVKNDGAYSHCCVLGLSIPISYYLVDRFNTFTLIEEGTPTIITIPIGNYNAISFMTIVIALLNNNSPHHYNYNMTFDNDFVKQATGKYTFTVSGCTTAPSLIFNSEGELHSQFGFSHNSTNVFTGSPPNCTMLSTAVVNFVSESVLTVWSDICEDTELITVFSYNAVPYSTVSFQCQSNLYSKKLRDEGLSNIYHFRLLNKNGQSLNLNGQPMIINLLLYTPEDETYKNDVKNYIKYKVSQ